MADKPKSNDKQDRRILEAAKLHDEGGEKAEIAKRIVRHVQSKQDRDFPAGKGGRR